MNFPKDKLDDVYWAVVMVRSDENGLARCAALTAGIPDHVSAVQVNRACCSSMETIRIASMRIRLGEGEAIIAGGGESMSNASFSIWIVPLAPFENATCGEMSLRGRQPEAISIVG